MGAHHVVWLLVPPMFAIRRPMSRRSVCHLRNVCKQEPRQNQRQRIRMRTQEKEWGGLCGLPCVCQFGSASVQCRCVCAWLACRKLNRKLLEKDENENENGEEGNAALPVSKRVQQDAAAAARYRRLNVRINVYTNYTAILKIGLFVGRFLCVYLSVSCSLCVYVFCWLVAICVASIAHWLASCVSLIVV